MLTIASIAPASKPGKDASIELSVSCMPELQSKGQQCAVLVSCEATLCCMVGLAGPHVHCIMLCNTCYGQH